MSTCSLRIQAAFKEKRRETAFVRKWPGIHTQFSPNSRPKMREAAQMLLKGKDIKEPCESREELKSVMAVYKGCDITINPLKIQLL